MIPATSKISNVDIPPSIYHEKLKLLAAKKTFVWNKQILASQNVFSLTKKSHICEQFQITGMGWVAHETSAKKPVCWEEWEWRWNKKKISSHYFHVSFISSFFLSCMTLTLIISNLLSGSKKPFRVILFSSYFLSLLLTLFPYIQLCFNNISSSISMRACFLYYCLFSCSWFIYIHHIYT